MLAALIHQLRAANAHHSRWIDGTASRAGGRTLMHHRSTISPRSVVNRNTTNELSQFVQFCWIELEIPPLVIKYRAAFSERLNLSICPYIY